MLYDDIKKGGIVMYLMHRISHEWDTALRLLHEEGLISIGWRIIEKNGLGENVISKVFGEKGDFINYFESLANELKNEYFTRRRGYYLYNFLRLEKGDKVIIPIADTITIVEVLDKPRLYSENDNKANVDIGFVVPVKKIMENIPRAEYILPDLASKFKYRGTNLVLSEEDYKEIEKTVLNFQKGEKSHSFDNHRINIIKIINEYLKNNVNENQFEKIIKEYFIRIGASETYIPPKNKKIEKNDRIADVDVIAKFESLRTVVYVQAKHHKGCTNDYGLEQLIKFEHENYDKFKHLNPLKWLITTGEIHPFTEEKSNQYNIRIISKDEFASMLYNAGMIEMPKL